MQSALESGWMFRVAVHLIFGDSMYGVDFQRLEIIML